MVAKDFFANIKTKNTFKLDYFPGFLFPAALVTFTEQILNGKFHFLCSVMFEKCITYRSLTHQKGLKTVKD